MGHKPPCELWMPTSGNFVAGRMPMSRTGESMEQEGPAEAGPCYPVIRGRKYGLSPSE